MPDRRTRPPDPAPPPALPRRAGRWVFAGLVYDEAAALLRLPAGQVVIPRPKTEQVLMLLLRRAGRLVTREELLARVWPGAEVSDDTLTQSISEIRRALGAEAVALRAVKRRGYVLDLTVEWQPAPDGPRGPAAADPSHAD